DGDGDGEGGGDPDCGGISLPGGVGGMGQTGECGDGGAAGEGATVDEAGGPGGEDGAGAAGGVGQYPGESDAERAARLGKELDESVGDFDEVLMEEQRQISTVSRNTEGFGTGGSGGSGGRVGLGGQAGGNSTSGSVSVLNPTDERQSSIGAMSEEDIQARLPDDIMENVGDDIVARQLYEAALAEDDPELRERLWEEYRKYNGL
ncbi:MAG: hypothetical protein IH930_10180, partial [Proteobacteria bacterium]|nr:hypothetical protein [Pseudomonadota bacterium]